MAGIDPMFNLMHTILDDKEVVVFLGAGASMEGEQNGKRFPGFDELIDTISGNWGFKPATSTKKRFENFLTVIKRWEQERILPARLRKYLGGEPGQAHYYLAALSITLLGKSNSMLYLTTNYDDLMKKAFTDLERNSGSKFDTVVLSLRPNIIGSEFQGIVKNIEDLVRKGEPVILKLFGDLNSQSPIFRKEDMIFEPSVEDKLIEWLRKPMIVIGYSFSDRIIEQLLISARGSSPVFLVNPSAKKIPSSVKNLERVCFIKKTFYGFILDLLEMFKDKNPSIIEKTDKILESFGLRLDSPGFREKKNKFEPRAFPGDTPKRKKPDTGVKRILILSANPITTPKLRLDEEIREIEEGLRRSKYRDRFVIHSRLAVRLRDLRRALLDYEPHIVHFTGHGNKEGLLVEDELGIAENISPDALSGLFALFSGKIGCVILSACYSESQADAISEHIDYVIGMQREIEDKAVIEFAVGFYDALGAGKSFEEAFKFGCSAIQFYKFPEHLIPVLKKKKNGLERVYQILQTSPTQNNENTGKPLSKKEDTTGTTPQRKRNEGNSIEIPGDVQKVGELIGRQNIKKNRYGYWEADHGNGIIMTYIPPGSFTMGSNENDDESPPQEVYLDGYWIGKTTVTVPQYHIFLSDNNSTPSDFPVQYCPENFPTVFINWGEANAYCDWLSRKTGLSFKLPTEAQWEKAARGHDSRKYPWGNREPDKNLTNYNCHTGLRPVGAYSDAASPYGLLDMTGNVWEWCSDWYEPDFYKKKINRNPTGPKNGKNKVIRGGGWRFNPRGVHCARRVFNLPDSRDDDLGFRLCQKIG